MSEEMKSAVTDKITFEVDKPVKVTLEYDDPTTGEGANGPWVKYTVSGDRCFFASEGLHKKLQEAGLKKGDTFTIIKVAIDGGKTAFNIELSHTEALDGVDKDVHESPLGAGFAQKDKKASGDYTLEQKVEILWKKHKDDDIPF